MATGEQETAGNVAMAQPSAEAVDVEQLVRELDAAFDRFPESTLRACQQHRDLVAPRLIQVFEEAIQVERQDKKRKGNAPIFALMLLGEFETPEFLPVLIEFLKLPGETTLDLLGDGVHEDVPRILATLAGDQLDVIDSLIADSRANEYVRWAAMSAHKFLVRDGRVPRRHAVERLAGLLRKELDREEEEDEAEDEARYTVVTAFVSTLVDLNGHEAVALIDEAYDRGLIEEFMIGDAKTIKAELSPDKPETYLRLDRRGPTKITDAVEEIRHWNWRSNRDAHDREKLGKDELGEDFFSYDGEDFSFGPAPLPGSWSPQRLADDLPDESGTVRHELPRVGRNDPCPCGSGKKYKKCCMRSSPDE